MLDCGDRIQVFDWHPSTDREKWQPATVENDDDHQMMVRLDACPEYLTPVLSQSNYWRPLDRAAL